MISEAAGSDCPPVKSYSRTIQNRAAGELRTLPRDSAIAGMLADYRVLRTQIGFCAGRRHR